ncbi:5-hydroxytryptamine receptor 1F-like [Ctenocephalides felis]|uniref:5-hydroxytryptamine receptor 1F-like n=1 Tax=Ctenocephalides felis TaxID=7515 RepID=UPI000E6E2CB2|nr:5-hydroxytryptamine receptor 1F-like [Ctenocephalides felis]
MTDYLSTIFMLLFHHRNKSNSVKLRIEIIDTEIDTSEADSTSSPARRYRSSAPCPGELTPKQTFKLSTATMCECQPLSDTQVTLHKTKIQNKLSSPSYRDSRMEYATTFALGSTGSPRSPFNRARPLRQRISSLRRETKTAQTLSIVVGGFVACWLPFFIYYILTPFLVQTDVSDQLMSILTWLGWINSAINPFIYAFYNVDFRTSFWRLTIGNFYKRR